MSDFDPAWLDLREPADAKARNDDIRRQVVAWASEHDSLRVIDLGCGTGAGFRALFRDLPVDQHWTLIDRDPALLEDAAARIAAMASVGGFEIDEDNVDLRLSRENRTLRLRLEERDLANLSFPDLLPDSALITCSALLDLTSAAWIDRLAGAAMKSNSAIYAALDVDGRVDIQPPDEGDDLILSAFRRHQTRDKGFGPALGPDATAYAANNLENLGCSVRVGSGEWSLGGDTRPLMLKLIEGWAEAAREVAPAESGAIDAWLARRREKADAGSLAVTVGHSDLFAVTGALA